MPKKNELTVHDVDDEVNILANHINDRLDVFFECLLRQGKAIVRLQDAREEPGPPPRFTVEPALPTVYPERLDDSGLVAELLHLRIIYGRPAADREMFDLVDAARPPKPKP